MDISAKFEHLAAQPLQPLWLQLLCAAAVGIARHMCVQQAAQQQILQKNKENHRLSAGHAGNNTRESIVSAKLGRQQYACGEHEKTMQETT